MPLIFMASSYIYPLFLLLQLIHAHVANVYVQPVERVSRGRRYRFLLGVAGHFTLLLLILF